jgi:pre-rRNA-processing protein IPI3
MNMTLPATGTTGKEIVISVSGNVPTISSNNKKSSSNSSSSNNNNNKNSSDSTSAIHVWDATTGGKLMNFKGCFASRNGLSLVGGPGCAYKIGNYVNTTKSSTHGYDFFLVSQSDRKAINAWTWGRSQPHFKCAMPEAIGPLCVTKSGIFCFGGSVTGRIFVWDLASGDLLRSTTAHFKQVTKICETHDGAYLITAGDDALIHVWNVIDLIETNNSMEQKSVKPLFSWTEHTLPITDIFCNIGGIHGHLWSTSMDHTCKVWSLSRQHLLNSISFPTYVTTVVTDAEERRVYIGGGDGKIYVTSVRYLRNVRSNNMNGGDSNNMNAMSNNHKSNTSDSSHRRNQQILEAHHGRINCLVMTLDSTRLISGGVDGIIVVWDATSCVSLKRLDMHLGPITSLYTLIKPLDLLVSKTQTLQQHHPSSKREKGKKVLRPLKPLQKHSHSNSSMEPPLVLSTLPPCLKDSLKCNDLLLVDSSLKYPIASNAKSNDNENNNIVDDSSIVKKPDNDNNQIKILKNTIESLKQEKLRWQNVAKELQDLLHEEAVQKDDEDILALPPKRSLINETNNDNSSSRPKKKGRKKK